MSTPKPSSHKGPAFARRASAALAPYASTTVAAVVLRFFLGGTMLYAGIDKTLLDPRFLQADGVGSIGETLRYFVTSGGPLAWLVEAVALPQPVLIGASMAGAQLLVGASLLTGSWVRYGALLGAGISLSLALTSTWGVSPYYYGNDLPYFVGFLALAALGDGGALRLGAPAERAYDPARRAALVSGTGVAAGIAALLVLDRSRAVSMITGGGTPTASTTPGASATATPSPGSSASPTPSGSPTAAPSSGATPKPTATPSASAPAAGTVISGAPGLAAGQALNFSAGGTDAVLIKDGSTYRAFERACTHAGTPVDWQEGSGDFLCSNHGARFSVTGQVTNPPANRPLRAIEVSVAADGTVTYRR
ncbi:MAG: Rieske 2Fe-2S domain-containing protein [Chloroflexi bacterium]|nr:Rieske 2Fe-2S domain-containing protein [Chloroflexota bacterium]